MGLWPTRANENQPACRGTACRPRTSRVGQALPLRVFSASEWTAWNVAPTFRACPERSEGSAMLA